MPDDGTFRGGKLQAPREDSHLPARYTCSVMTTIHIEQGDLTAATFRETCDEIRNQT
jgi:hypothetical protein